MANKSVSDRFAEIVSNLGVQSVFTLTGGHIVPLLDSCSKKGLEIIDVRHEQTAVFAAEGYSRISGKLGVAIVTAGPGVMNSINSVASAYFSNVPLLLVGGRHLRSQEGRGGLQEFDHPPLLESITKYSGSIMGPEDFEKKMQTALNYAYESRGGPVFLDIPLDVQFEYIKKKNQPIKIANQEKITPNEKKLVKQIKKEMDKVKRPVLLIGSRVENVKKINFIVKESAIPVYLSGQARGTIPYSSKQNFSRSRSYALQNADLVLALGVDFDFRLKYGNNISSKAKIITVDSDKAKLAWNVDPYISVNSTPDQFIDAYSNEKIETKYDEWTKEVKRVEIEKSKNIEDSIKEHKGFHPEHFAKLVSDYIGNNSIVAVDGGDIVSSTARKLKISKPGWLLEPGPFGSLGTGPGHALGAKIAKRKKNVFIIFGDGGFGFNGFEFDTFVRLKIPIVGIIGMDGVWNNIKTFHEMISPGDTVAATLGDRPYHKVVESLGGYGELVKRPEDLIPALERAIKSGKPSLINVKLDRVKRSSSNYEM